jgi:hypothetical protein
LNAVQDPEEDDKEGEGEEEKICVGREDVRE